MLIQPIQFVWAESGNKTKTKEITMTALDAVKLAGKLIDKGDIEHAKQILTKMPQTKSLPVEIERWYLLAQIEQKNGNYDEAIKIYRKILDDQPDLVKIRYELALCYMAKKQWYRADYHLRLAMAGKDLPDNVKQMMNYYRYVVRQNKRWNIWFNFGAAPESNINQASGNQVCGYYNGYFYGCSASQDPERVMGYNVLLGGNYEFVLSDHWRWKTDANIYSNIYNKHDYDDLYLSASTGPRYIWSRGDVWLSGIGSRRWYGGEKYNYAYGTRLDTNYDFTRRLSGGLSLRYMENRYDEYGKILDGQIYSSNFRVSYSFDATKYMILRFGVDRDTAKEDAYANWRYSTGIGLGSELPFGFHVYVEPYFMWTNYDADRFDIISENSVIKTRYVTARDFLQRYSMSLSNNKFDVWGFVPTINLSYTKRDSNIKSREYEDWSVGFTMQQRF